MMALLLSANAARLDMADAGMDGKDVGTWIALLQSSAALH